MMLRICGLWRLPYLDLDDPEILADSRHDVARISRYIEEVES
jgi:hypothetical protein